jgi:hypothetical protein
LCTPQNYQVKENVELRISNQIGTDRKQEFKAFQRLPWKGPGALPASASKVPGRAACLARLRGAGSGCKKITERALSTKDLS